MKNISEWLVLKISTSVRYTGKVGPRVGPYGGNIIIGEILKDFYQYTEP